MNKVFMGEWEESGMFGMIADFSDVYITEQEYRAEKCPYANEVAWMERKADMQKALSAPEFQGIKVLIADYEQGGYEGDAFVLFERDGKLWEVNAGHCSCHGLEGQWDPEEVTMQNLSDRLNNSGWGRFHDEGEFREAMKKILF